MKYIFLIFFVLVACEKKYPIEVQQKISNEMVTILPSLKNPLLKDSVVISLPIEFEIKPNLSFRYVGWHYKVDGKTLNDNNFDYQVYNKQNKMETIYQLDFDKRFEEKLINIILKERNHLISKKDAQELLKKYNINKSLDDLKFRDTIKLTTYINFRNQNKSFINELNKINDTIMFRVMKDDGSFLYIDKKINW